VADPRLWLALVAIFVAYFSGRKAAASLRAAATPLVWRNLATSVAVEQGEIRIRVELDNEVAVNLHMGADTSRRIAEKVQQEEVAGG
jgi:hypothetical protein